MPFDEPVKYSLINDNGAPRLILFFAGWGMDNKPFSSLKAPEGYDLAIVWDYRDEELTLAVDRYKEICVVAWSFGVVAACRWIMGNISLPLTRCIAVAGTPYPVDDHQGIPEPIFKATLNNLDASNLTKFYRRMAGSKAAFAAFSENLPDRDVDELAEELRTIARLGGSCLPISVWDEVIVAMDDRIIPPGNQLAAWNGHCNLLTLDAPHLIDFQSVLDRTIVAKETVSRRFSESSVTYDANATVQHEIALSLADMWVGHRCPTEIDVAVELGTGTGQLTRLITPRLRLRYGLTLVDLTIPPEDLPGEKILADGELYIRQLPDSSVDLIFSASTMQWFNSPGKFLAECSRVLRPGGVALLSTFGNKNYRELAQYLAFKPHYTSLSTLRELLPKELEEIGGFEWEQIVDYESPKELLRHIRLTGVNASGGSPDALRRALDIVRDGVTVLTYNPVAVLFRRK